ncbi:cyclophilin-like fold protein [Cellulomonas soli]|uniref:cyclophilin-like fold protein n=1 Tax=Cellulomonas soli TaxID=931535 RepID=UPI003F84EE8B
MPLPCPRWSVVALVGLVAATLGARSGADVRGPASDGGSTASDPVAPTAPTAAGATAARSSAAPSNAGSPIRVGETVLEGRLWDTAPSRALIDQLPLTLTVSDLNGVEKTGRLPQERPALSPQRPSPQTAA